MTTRSDVIDWLSQQVALAAAAKELLEGGAQPDVVPTLPDITTKPGFMQMMTTNLGWLSDVVGIPVNDQARVIEMTIAGQESNWQYRLQQGGPARSFWQFESGGGVAGVLSHPASSQQIKTVCAALRITCNQSTVYEAMAWNDQLAVAMARLLLWTDPAALPAVGDVNGAWNYYLRNWRPGKPYPDKWPGLYQQAMNLL